MFAQNAAPPQEQFDMVIVNGRIIDAPFLIFGVACGTKKSALEGDQGS
jgi:hypothetical protein